MVCIYVVYTIYSGVCVYIYTDTHTRVNENHVKVSAAAVVGGGEAWSVLRRGHAIRSGEKKSRRWRGGNAPSNGGGVESGVSVVKVDGLLFSFSSARRRRSLTVSLFVSGKHAYSPSRLSTPFHGTTNIRPTGNHQLTASPSPISYIHV